MRPHLIWCQVLREEYSDHLDLESKNLLDAVDDLSAKCSNSGLGVKGKTGKLKQPPRSSDVEMCQEILYSCSAHLGLEDALMGGCGRKRLLNSAARNLDLEGKWTKSLAIYDMKLSHQSPEGTLQKGQIQRGLVNAMMNSGCYNTMSAYLEGMSAYQRASCDLTGLQCESSWRLSKWDSEVVTASSGAVRGRGDGFTKHRSLATFQVF